MIWVWWVAWRRLWGVGARGYLERLWDVDLERLWDWDLERLWDGDLERLRYLVMERRRRVLG